MLPHLPILLPLAIILPLGLTVPSPRRSGGGGGGSSSSGSNLALAGLAGVVIANSDNGYSINGQPPPDSGYDGSGSCSYSGGSATNADATDPSWISAMTGCLNLLGANDWSGNECAPSVGGTTFGFWKGEDDYSDPVDCYQRCVGCLSSAVNASQAVTTKCQYEYRTHRSVAGYKTHTCTMGYDAGS